MPKSNPPTCRDDQPVIPLPTSCIPTSIDQKKAFDALLGMQELQQDANNAAQRLLMDPFDKLVDKEEKANAAKEASCLLHIKLLQDQFAHAAHQKVDGLLMDTSHMKTAQMYQILVMMVFMEWRMTMKTRTSATTYWMDWQRIREMTMESWVRMLLARLPW